MTYYSFIILYDFRLVFTASSDGVIFKWDAESLKIEHRFHLEDIQYLHDIQFCANFLLCGK